MQDIIAFKLYVEGVNNTKMQNASVQNLQHEDGVTNLESFDRTVRSQSVPDQRRMLPLRLLCRDVVRSKKGLEKVCCKQMNPCIFYRVFCCTHDSHPFLPAMMSG